LNRHEIVHSPLSTSIFMYNRFPVSWWNDVGGRDFLFRPLWMTSLSFFYINYTAHGNVWYSSWNMTCVEPPCSCVIYATIQEGLTTTTRLLMWRMHASLRVVQGSREKNWGTKLVSWGTLGRNRTGKNIVGVLDRGPNTSSKNISILITNKNKLVGNSALLVTQIYMSH
jgi:hypothetical protein